MERKGIGRAEGDVEGGVAVDGRGRHAKRWDGRGAAARGVRRFSYGLKADDGRSLLCMKSSEQDKGEGTLKKAEGSVKKAVGQATDNERLEAEGRADKAEGSVQKKTGDVKKVFDQ